MKPNQSRQYAWRELLKSPYLWLLLGCLVTLLAMWGYPHLPDKRLQLVTEQSQAYIYADERNSADWIDMEAMHWRCDIGASHQEAFCGFHIPLNLERHGIDLSGFDRILVGLDYSGPASSLRYYLRSYVPGFSSDGIESHKFNQTQISVGFLSEGLSIGFDEFYVAEWWLHEYRVPRQLSGPSFDHVTAFGIDLAYPAAGGVHELQLHSVELVGALVPKDRWYAGIILAWVLVLSLFGGYRLYDLSRRVKVERFRARKAAERNRELRSESELYRHMSERDHLTGLLNRQGISKVIERLFAEDTTGVSLLVIDIDRFKSINDTHGHEVGDRILKQLGRVLAECTRQSDALGRWGGEEFVLLLPGTDRARAPLVADKLRKRIAETRFEALPGHTITVSIGVGDRQRDEPYHTLFQRVDMALYRAKNEGRNRVEEAVEA